MKIIHCADLHIDSKMQTNFSIEKAHQRKKELLLTFERMVEYANKEGVKAIIIAGDMFDTSKVTTLSKKRIFSIINSNQAIDFLYLAGNHDESNIICSLEQEYANLKVFKENWTTFTYDNVNIVGATNTSNVTMYDTLSLNKDDINLVVLHGPISKYNLKDNKEIVKLNKLKNKNIDYLALGHIHSFEQGKLDERGVYCYSGCIEGRGFDECGEKGFVVLNIDNDCIHSEFVPFARREFHQIDVDITDKEDWFDIEKIVLDKVKSIPTKDIIKVVLTGKYCLALYKQVGHLTTRLNDDFYFAKIKDESSLKINVKDYENDLSLKGEFIREVLNSDLDQEEKEKVILIGITALNGEELK